MPDLAFKTLAAFHLWATYESRPTSRPFFLLSSWTTKPPKGVQRNVIHRSSQVTSFAPPCSSSSRLPGGRSHFSESSAHCKARGSLLDSLVDQAVILLPGRSDIEVGVSQHVWTLQIFMGFTGSTSGRFRKFRFRIWKHFTVRSKQDCTDCPSTGTS